MTPACPTCRAPWRESTECARCGSDLAPLMRVAAAAWRQRRAAVAALEAGDSGDALAHVLKAAALQRTDEAVELMFLTRVAAVTDSLS